MEQLLYIIKTCLVDKLLNIKDRGSRKEFFAFNFFTWLTFKVLNMLQAPYKNQIELNFTDLIISLTLHGISLFVLLALFTALMRRLHDTNRSGIHMIPIVIGIVVGLCGVSLGESNITIAGVVIILLATLYLLVLTCLPGTKGLNSYGPPPSEIFHF